MLHLIEAIFLGIAQGVLEWFPVSSQGNLVLIMILMFGFETSDILDYSIYLHIGTGFAALLYFRGKVFDILIRRTEKDKRLFNYLFISTLITGLLGFPLYHIAESTLFLGESLLALTGVALIFTGVIQKKTERIKIKESSKLSVKHGLLVGALQSLAALPGMSRSGLTTSILLMLGFTEASSLEVSFLMSIPAVFAAAIGLFIIEGPVKVSSNIIVSIITSFISAYLTIDALLRLAKRINFWKLCFLLGIIALINIVPCML